MTIFLVGYACGVGVGWFGKVLWDQYGDKVKAALKANPDDNMGGE